MKKILILLVLIPIFGYSQSRKQRKEADKYDVYLHNYIYGAWEHVKSVYPSGNEEFYYRRFELYKDSVYVCKDLYLEDTIVKYGYWFVQDTCIFLYGSVYNVYMDSIIVTLNDVVYIEYLDLDKMFLKRTWGEDFGKKTSYYERAK